MPIPGLSILMYFSILSSVGGFAPPGDVVGHSNFTHSFQKYVFPYRLAFFVRSLTIVGKPLALCHFHIGEGCLKGRILRAASIDAETDFPAAMPHMANPHLGEILPIGGTLDTIVILPAAEAIPHRLDGSVDSGSGPIGVAVVGHHTAKVLELLVFVFNRALQPIFAVQIHNHAALIETVLAFKFRFHNKGEKPLVRLHLEHRRVVVTEVVIGSLPQVGVGLGDDLHLVIGHSKMLRLSCPLEMIDSKFHSLLPYLFLAAENSAAS